jgi:hypothetical protein
MSDLFWLYLLTRLDAIKALGIALAVVLGIVALISIIAAAESYEDDMGKAVSRAKKAVFGLFIVLGFVALIPSTSSAMFILGGAAVLDAAKSEPARRIAGKSIQFIERFLDEQLKKAKE